MQRFRRRKHDWQGYCIIHGSKNNNGCFGYNDTGKWNCLSCGAHGSGAIDLVKAVRNLNFTAARELLEPLVGKEPVERKKEPVEAPNAILRPYTGTYAKYFVDNEWLSKRIPDT